MCSLVHISVWNLRAGPGRADWADSGRLGPARRNFRPKSARPGRILRPSIVKRFLDEVILDLFSDEQTAESQKKNLEITTY